MRINAQAKQQIQSIAAAALMDSGPFSKGFTSGLDRILALVPEQIRRDRIEELYLVALVALDTAPVSGRREYVEAALIEEISK